MEEKSHGQATSPWALLILNAQVIKPIEKISQPLGRKERSSLRPVIDPLTHRHHLWSTSRSEDLNLGTPAQGEGGCVGDGGQQMPVALPAVCGAGQCLAVHRDRRPWHRAGVDVGVVVFGQVGADRGVQGIAVEGGQDPGERDRTGRVDVRASAGGCRVLPAPWWWRAVPIR
jgi:hypothetical protein